MTSESGRYFWVRGDTIRYRQELRDAGGCWDRDAVAWRFPWAQRQRIALHVTAYWHGCTLHVPTPELPWPRPDDAFVRLRLVSLPLVWNSGAALATVGDFYDVEEGEGLLFCYPLLKGVRGVRFFLCLEEALAAHFESQV